MLELMQDLPDGVVGVEAKGKVEESDYKDILVPAIDRASETHEKVRVLFVLGEDYDGFTLGAAWDDMRLGVRHPASFDRVALVTDKDWMRHSVTVFGWMIPGEVRVFGSADLSGARAWVSS